MPGIGEVEVELNGETVVLKSSLAAGYALADLGGAAMVWRRLAEMDLRAYVAVVAAGLNKQPREVEKAVYSTGMSKLSEPLALYVGYLANGGRPAEEKQDEPSGEA